MRVRYPGYLVHDRASGISSSREQDILFIREGYQVHQSRILLEEYLFEVISFVTTDILKQDERSMMDITSTPIDIPVLSISISRISVEGGEAAESSASGPLSITDITTLSNLSPNCSFRS